MSDQWLAAYLYYESPWNQLLTEAVKPLIKEVMDKELANGYFFIRYWEKGPHIRLRFRGDRERLEAEVKPLIEKQVGDFFKKYPSTVAEGAPREDCYPNNSIQFIEYEPEIARYGGPVGLKIAERQFQISSEAILEAIEEAGNLDYERALGLAIQMHLSFVYAMDMDFKKLHDFFQLVSYGWISRAYYHDKSMTEADHEAKREEVRQLFDKTYQQQKDGLMAFCRALWEGLNQGASFEQDWLNNWVSGMKSIRQELVTHDEELMTRNSWFTTKEMTTTPEERRTWSILESYVHMVNNRLGIQNRDEAFLGYLISTTMTHLKSEFEA